MRLVLHENCHWPKPYGENETIGQWVTGSIQGKINGRPWFYMVKYHQIHDCPDVVSLKPIQGVEMWRPKVGMFTSKSWKTCKLWWRSDVMFLRKSEIMVESHSATCKKITQSPLEGYCTLQIVPFLQRNDNQMAVAKQRKSLNDPQLGFSSFTLW